MKWDEFYQQPRFVQIGMLRQWVEERKHRPYQFKKIPVWMMLAQRKTWWCLEDLLAKPKEQMLLNHKDKDLRGWLHYAVYLNMPDQLALKGLEKLDHTWLDQDRFGNTPFDIFPSPALAQGMARRWWTQYTPDPAQTQTFFSHLETEAKKAGHEDVARVWSFWAQKHAFGPSPSLATEPSEPNLHSQDQASSLDGEQEPSEKQDMDKTAGVGHNDDIHWE